MPYRKRENKPAQKEKLCLTAAKPFGRKFTVVRNRFSRLSVRRQKEVVEHNHGLPQDHVTSRVHQMPGG